MLLILLLLMLFSNCFLFEKTLTIDVVLGFNTIMLSIKKKKKYYFNIFLIKKYLYKNMMHYVRSQRNADGKHTARTC
jgi:hypothetical protein